MPCHPVRRAPDALAIAAGGSPHCRAAGRRALRLWESLAGPQLPQIFQDPAASSHCPLRARRHGGLHRCAVAPGAQVRRDKAEFLAAFPRCMAAPEEPLSGAPQERFALHFRAHRPRYSRSVSLFLVRPKKDLRCISELTDLEYLGLSGFTLPDLSLLLPLGKLRKLDLFLGGTRNLAALAQLPALEELRLMRITKQ